MRTQVRAIANNDLAYLWRSVSEKIPGCPPKTTDAWPVQAFPWKDVMAPAETDLRYRIIPIGGTPREPIPLAEPMIETPFVRLSRFCGPLEITFNRGLIATQALNRGLRKSGSNATDLRKLIGQPGNPFRKRPAKDMGEAVTSLLRRARDNGGRCLCALQELSDPELIEAIVQTPKTEVILSNADSRSGTAKKYDGTNEAARRRLRQSPGVIVHDRWLNNQKPGPLFPGRPAVNRRFS